MEGHSVKSTLETAREALGRVIDADKRHGMSEELHDKFLSMANEAGRLSTANLFTPVSEEYIRQTPTPDAVNYHKTLLHPNVASTAEQDEVLDLLGMFGEQVPELTQTFADYAQEYSLFERVTNGEKFILPSNHLMLADQGFNLGFLHLAGRKQGHDRLENYMTAMIGAFLGYHELGGKNVIDDILRKACSVIKTLPVSGGEALPEAQVAETELDKNLKDFRKHLTSQAREAMHDLMSQPGGRFLQLALGGSWEYANEFGVVQMGVASEGTSQSLVRACKVGAWIIPTFTDYELAGHSLVGFGKPTQIKKLEEVHEVGVTIAKIGNALRREASKQFPDNERFSQPIEYLPDQTNL